MIYTGVIEDTQDPQGSSGRLRVRVRVRQIHGNITTEMLPWAEVMCLGGGAYDMGGQFPFVRGASVVVGFEGDDYAHPIVLGGISKKVAAYQTYGEDGNTWGPTDEQRSSEQGSDLSAEAAVAADPRNIHLIYKSPKGACVYIDETDGGECLRIVDRAGQVFEMGSPVSAEVNANNAAQRGLKDCAAGTGMEYTTLPDPAFVRVTDLAGNTIEMWSESGNERVLVTNPVNNSSLEFGPTGLTITVLGGVSASGVTIQVTADGLRVNGKYLVTEEMVSWLNAFKTMLVQSTKPGNPEPIFPAALSDFLQRVSASMNTTGLKTQL